MTDWISSDDTIEVVDWCERYLLDAAKCMFDIRYHAMHTGSEILSILLVVTIMWAVILPGPCVAIACHVDLS